MSSSLLSLFSTALSTSLSCLACVIRMTGVLAGTFDDDADDPLVWTPGTIGVAAGVAEGVSGG